MPPHVNIQRLLPERADSERSWTVDITARRAEAKRQAAPFRAEAEKLNTKIAETREEIKKWKASDDGAAPDIVAELQSSVNALGVRVRELNAKAQSIEDAAFDLKAVNPNVKSVEDKRTPDQLLDFIEAKGREVAEALAALRGATLPN